MLQAQLNLAAAQGLQMEQDKGALLDYIQELQEVSQTHMISHVTDPQQQDSVHTSPGLHVFSHVTDPHQHDSVHVNPANNISHHVTSPQLQASLHVSPARYNIAPSSLDHSASQQLTAAGQDDGGSHSDVQLAAEQRELAASPPLELEPELHSHVSLLEPDSTAHLEACTPMLSHAQLASSGVTSPLHPGMAVGPSPQHAQALAHAPVSLQQPASAVTPMHHAPVQSLQQQIAAVSPSSQHAQGQSSHQAGIAVSPLSQHGQVHALQAKLHDLQHRADAAMAAASAAQRHEALVAAQHHEMQQTLHAAQQQIAQLQATPSRAALQVLPLCIAKAVFAAWAPQTAPTHFQK